MDNTVPNTNNVTTKEEKSAQKIAQLMASYETLSTRDLRDRLSEEEMRDYKIKLYAKLTQLDLQQDILTRKICNVSEIPINELMQERNQRKIQQAILRLLNMHGHMPNKTQLSEYTGLSRKTIRKHLEENMNSSSTLAQEYAIMAPQVINKVMQTALRGEGDMRAAKLYLDITANLLNNTQAKPNYLSVNGSVITQADIERLNDEQRKKLLELVRG